MVEMSVRYIAHDTLRCEHTRNANCQHCILAIGLFLIFFFFLSIIKQKGSFDYFVLH